MDLRHLHHFDTLARAGSLHRAARQLGLRQPALSQSIRALETDVGTRLIERSPTGSRLTQAGGVFLKEIRAILAALERAVHSARLAASSATPLRLGIAGDIATGQVVAALQKFHQNYPANPLVLGDGSPLRQRSMLATGLLDLALLPAEAVSDLPDTEPLWPVEVHLALPAFHPLAATLAIDLHRLKDVPLVSSSVHRHSVADRILLDACRTVGIEPRIAIMVSGLEVRLVSVAAGLGVAALIPTGPALAAIGGIVSRPFRPPLRLMVAAAWPSSGLTPEARHFLDLARHTDGAVPPR